MVKGKIMMDVFNFWAEMAQANKRFTKGGQKGTDKL